MHAPALGPASWAPVAAALQGRGAEALTARYTVGDPPSYERAAAKIAAHVSDAGWTTVLHSGAGALAPSIAEACDASFIFVDAILPHSGQSWLETAPPALASRLGRLCVGGRLPPWNAWFEQDPIASLGADPATQVSLRQELPSLPLAWFALKAPAAPGWPNVTRCAYLQLSDAYGAEASVCEARGWAVRRLRLGHLGIVTQPDMVAAELMSLAT